MIDVIEKCPKNDLSNQKGGRILGQIHGWRTHRHFQIECSAPLSRDPPSGPYSTKFPLNPHQGAAVTL